MGWLSSELEGTRVGVPPPGGERHRQPCKVAHIRPGVCAVSQTGSLGLHPAPKTVNRFLPPPSFSLRGEFTSLQGQIASLQGQIRGVGSYRGTWPTRNSVLLGPYSRTMPRALWWSQGGVAVSYEQGTPRSRRIHLSARANRLFCKGKSGVRYLGGREAGGRVARGERVVRRRGGVEGGRRARLGSHWNHFDRRWSRWRGESVFA